MNEPNKHIIYTAADIKKYLAGGMSPAEMHAIEMAALDDPFLAEAMEGYEIMEEKDYSKEILLLQQHFNTAKASPVIPISKAPAYKWWRAAAAILLIGSTVALAYLFTNKKQTSPETTAKLTIKQIPAAATTTSDSIATLATTTTALNQGTANPGEAYKTTESATADLSITSNKSEAYNYDIAKAEATQKADSNFIYKPSPTNTNTWAAKDGIAAERADDKESKQMMEEKTIAQAPGYNSNAPSVSNNNIQANEGFIDNYNFRKKETASQQSINNAGTISSNYFYAEVVTPDNKPVGLANVKIPQTNKPIYTDANGRFKFAAADSSVKVTVTSAGYNTQSFTLSNTYQQNRIVLQPLDIATQKIGTAGKRKAAVKKIEILSDTSSEDDEDDASPSGGWVQYNNYLNNNLVMPNEAKTKNIHGEVELTIQLKNNGEVSQVKVAKPLCSQCDAEALRLVKEGPKFEVKNKKAKEVKVKVKF